MVNDKLTELDEKVSNIKLDTIDNYRDMRKDLETIFADVMTKMNKDSPPNINPEDFANMQTSPGDMPMPPGGMPNMSEDTQFNPSIDEVD